MVSGSLGSTRDKPRFVEDGRKLSFGETICCTGQLTATVSNGIVNSIPAHYCPSCRKMIIETGVEK